MWGRRTLRGRVALVGLGAIAAWVAVLTIVFNIVLFHRLDQQAADIAKARAISASATVRLGSDGRPRALESAGDAALDYGIWIYRGASAVQRPSAPRDLQQLADSIAASDVRAATTDDATLFAVPVVQHGIQVATVIASVSLAPYERAEHTTVVGSVIVALLLLLGAYPVLRFAGRRALQPVERMTHQAREWSAHAPDHRFGGGQHFTELHDLASTLDGVLDRLSAVLRHERQLSAELSHELRTPLSTIVAETDLLIRRQPGEVAYRSIHDSAMSMDEIIETLLTTARAELQSDDAACDVRAEVERLVAGRRGHIEVRDDHRPIAGVDATVLTRLLSPIIDNVVRYAHETVSIEIARDDAAVRIDIANDGAPIAPGDQERIFDAGYSGGDGAGLGLTLARRLARAAEGDVVCVPRTRGAVFVVTLPPG